MKNSASRVGAVAKAADTLRRRIVAGGLPPRTALVERTLAEKLGVGRATVRAALHLLEREGYVVTEEAGKYSKAVVAPLTLDDMQEVHEVLGAIYGVAARRNAALAREPRNHLVQALVETNNHLRRVAEQDSENFTALSEADRRFHGLCLERAQNRRLMVLHDIMAPQQERYSRMYATAVVGKGAVSAREHDDIIDAIRRGDHDGAELATMHNFLGAADRLGDVIQSLGQGQTW